MENSEIIVHHADHGIGEQAMAFVLAAFAKEPAGFHILSITLPQGLSVPCALYGPTARLPLRDTDTVDYAIRGDREGPSRMVTAAAYKTDEITAIGAVNDGERVLYTVYGGPAAPREPWDPTLATPAEWVESREFWAEHALAAVGQEGLITFVAPNPGLGAKVFNTPNETVTKEIFHRLR